MVPTLVLLALIAVPIAGWHHPVTAREGSPGLGEDSATPGGPNDAQAAAEAQAERDTAAGEAAAQEAARRAAAAKAAAARQAADRTAIGAAAAAVAPRRSLAERLEPLWVDLTPAQQQALAPFAPEWNTWPSTEKKSWVTLADKLPAMSPAMRARAERRILEWANLTPAERRVARENYRLAKERPAEQRVHEWENYQSLTRDQRTVLRHAGRTTNTAAGYVGAATGLAKEASQPLPRQSPTPSVNLLNSLAPVARPPGNTPGNNPGNATGNATGSGAGTAPSTAPSR